MTLVEQINFEEGEKESTSELTLHERLLSVWEKCAYVHRDAAPKDKSGNIKFTAVSYDGVVSKIRPFLREAGILVYPDAGSFSVEIDPEDLHPGGADQHRVVVRVGIRFVNAYDPKDFIIVPGFAMGVTNKYTLPEQLSGSLQTYAYKSCLRYGLMLETGDDPDLEARPYGPEIPPEIQEKIDLIRELGQVTADAEHEGDLETYIRHCLEAMCLAKGRPVRSIEHLSEPMLDVWIANLQKKKTKSGKPKAKAEKAAIPLRPAAEVPKEERFQALVDYMNPICDAKTAGDRIVAWLAERKLSALSLKEDKPWLRAWDAREKIASG